MDNKNVDSDLIDIVSDSSNFSDSTQIRSYAYMLYPDSVDVQKFIELCSAMADKRRQILISPLHNMDKFLNIHTIRV